MSTRCIIRKLLLPCSAALALAMWPSLSQATTVNVLTWTDNTTGLNMTGGSLNLENNALVIQTPDPAAALAAYNYIYGQISSGLNNGGYAAGTPGIVSDSTPSNTAHLTYPSAFTDPLGITGVGVVINDANAASPFSANDPGWSSWNGVAVNSNSVLVGFTYNGDTDMSGAVFSYDVSNAVDSYIFSPTQGGWANGESDYTGTVDSTSVSNVIDAYIFQGQDPIVVSTNPSASAASFGGAVSVPEPSAILLGLLGMIGLAVGLGIRNRNLSAEALVAGTRAKC
jgi:hypothetical protein